MRHVNTDQKLQLIQTIRSQNQYNRMKCREREQFLYGSGNGNEKRELYGAEAAVNYPLTGENVIPGKKNSVFTGFRLRFLAAVILFSVFIYLDRNDIDILGKTSQEFFDILTENISLPFNLPSSNPFDL